MAKKSKPDHAGRMPDHPRYGNPSDPAEEETRIRGAFQNVQDWQDKYGAQFSGGVTMGYGDKSYHVPIGDPAIADRIVSRPIGKEAEAKALPEPAPPPIPVQESWITRLLNSIKGAFK